MGADAVFRVEGLRKYFGQNEVLGGISLDLYAGEVTVLMGANGAGKSTLVKIISGVYTHGGGTMRLAGRAFDPQTPAEAIRAGVV
ncbi:ATP-binding cassette domain-containing protein, partial [Mesorhizobium sp. M2D.F.Ca.ET.223.01.1.1]